MRTLTLIPGLVGVHVAEHHDRPVALMTLVGTGDFAEITLEVVLDAATCAGLEASLGEARQLLRQPAER